MKIPKNEKLVVSYSYDDEQYYITRCADNSGYIGYKNEGGKLVKLCKKKSPLEVEEMFTGKVKETGVKQRAKKVDRE